MKFYAKQNILMLVNTITLILLLSAPNIALSKNDSIKSITKSVKSTEIKNLINHLKSDDFNQRISAQKSLIDIGPDAIPFLGEALLGENEIVACTSARILGEFGIQGAPPIIKFLKDSKYRHLNLPRHSSVFDALNRIGPEVITHVSHP